MDRDRIERISKALADGTRLMIFEAISRRHGMNCGDLVSLQGVTAATVSHHVKILADAGLIECQKKGQFVHNRVVPETIAEYSKALAKLATQPADRKGNRVAAGRRRVASRADRAARRR